MAQRFIVICDYCGAEEDRKTCYSCHDAAEGRLPPRFVTVEIRALDNENNRRFIRSSPPRHVTERTGRGQSSTNGTIRLELCDKCAGKPLFAHFEVHDPTPEEPIAPPNGEADG